MIQTSLICGNGEIGSALGKVLKDYNPHFIDIDITKTTEDLRNQYDYLHIAIPFSDSFISSVQDYQERFKPKFTVIHSTVPVGVSRKLNAIHSPCRGIHPNLESGIRTFVKFLGGEQASDIADYFRRVGLRVCLFDKSETTEALKLFDTEYYRICVEFAHRVKRYCDKYDLNYSEVYRIANTSYNEGYIDLNHPEFVRPVLEPIMKQIGGHCVLSNKELIKLSEDA